MDNLLKKLEQAAKRLDRKVQDSKFTKRYYFEGDDLRQLLEAAHARIKLQCQLLKSVSRT